VTSDEQPGKGQILVVDDEEMIRYLLENVLSQQGYQVTCVGSGREALTRLEEVSYDLVLTDLLMPGMDGIELLRRIRLTCPQTDVLVITGHASVETAVQAMKEGAYSYLTKPFNMDELVMTVRNCLEARQLRLEKERLSALVSLLELGHKLTSNLDPASLYDQIMAQVTQTFAPDYASIMLLDHTGRLILTAQYGLPTDVRLGGAYPVANTIAGQVMQQQESVLLLKDALPSRFVPYAHRSNIGSALCVPLSYRNRTLGVLNVARRTDRPPYRQEDLQLLSVFAMQATIAIQNALLYQNLRDLERTGWRLTAILDRQQVIRTALEVVQNILRSDVATLCLWDEAEDQLVAYVKAARPPSETNMTSLRHRLMNQAGLFVLRQPEPVRLRMQVLESDTGAEGDASERPLAAFLSAPLLRGNQVFGTLTCASNVESAFDEESLWVLSTLASTVAIALQNATAYENLKEFNLQVIASLSTALEARDPYTRGHSERVAVFATAIATEMGLPESEVERLRIAGLLHDIGKVRVSDLILNKPGPLTDEEWESMKLHPVVGAEIVAGLASLRDIAPIIRHHHEYYDGSGYPDGLAGRDIPFLARILTVADGFEAMISTRAYRQSLSVSKALEIMYAGRDRQWDGRVVEVWSGLVKRNPALVTFQPTGKVSRHAGWSVPAAGPTTPGPGR